MLAVEWTNLNQTRIWELDVAVVTCLRGDPMER